MQDNKCRKLENLAKGVRGMTEKPIIFSTEMVRAILEGRKTMTRRVVKPQPFLVLSEQEWQARALSGIDYVRPLNSYTPEELVAKCPYGTSGDILWVRETWAKLNHNYKPDYNGNIFVYKADHITGNDGPDIIKWRSPIYMPREAARLFLKVKNIRLERLQAITEQDAVAEGFVSTAKTTGDDYTGLFARDQFAEYWDKLHAKRGYRWDQNPWVWVIEFEVLKERI